MPDLSFAEVLFGRRSTRRAGSVSLRSVFKCLEMAMRPRYELVHDRFHRIRSPAISAGALHPIHAIAIKRGRFPKAFLYDHERHELVCMKIDNLVSLERLLANVAVCLPESRGLVLSLVADLWKVHAAYEHPESLIWRDAGALMQTLHMCAEAMGLAFCPLGILGNEILSALSLDQERSLAVGCACVGVRL